MSEELQNCLAAATNEVLRCHFFSLCESVREETAPADFAEYHQPFCGTLNGTLSLKLDPQLAAALASRYSPEPADISGAISDLKRMICGSAIHRFRPGAKVRFGIPPAGTESAHGDLAEVTLRLVEGLLQVGMTVCETGTA